MTRKEKWKQKVLDILNQTLTSEEAQKLQEEADAALERMMKKLAPYGT